jgi:hypothetical protein
VLPSRPALRSALWPSRRLSPSRGLPPCLQRPPPRVDLRVLRGSCLRRPQPGAPPGVRRLLPTRGSCLRRPQPGASPAASGRPPPSSCARQESAALPVPARSGSRSAATLPVPARSPSPSSCARQGRISIGSRRISALRRHRICVVRLRPTLRRHHFCAAPVPLLRRAGLQISAPSLSSLLLRRWLSLRAESR